MVFTVVFDSNLSDLKCCILHTTLSKWILKSPSVRAGSCDIFGVLARCTPVSKSY